MNDDSSFVRRITEAAARFDSMRVSEKANLQNQVHHLFENFGHGSASAGISSSAKCLTPEGEPTTRSS